MYEHKKEPLEQYVVKLLLQSEPFMRNYCSKIKPEYFAAQYRPLIWSLLHFWKEKQRVPNRKILEDIYIPKLFSGEGQQERRETAIACVGMIYELDIDVGEFTTTLKTEIDEFLFKRNLVTKLLTAYETLEEDVDKAVGILKEGLETSFDDTLGIDYFEDLDAREKRMSDVTEIAVDSGINSLNAALGGGYRKKAFYVFAGPANSGKSLILNDAAVNLVKLGKNVIYICLELSEDYVAQRTDAKFGDISMNILNSSPAQGIQKVRAKLKVMQDEGRKIGTLWYKEYAPNAASYMDIVALLRNLEAKRNLKFDFVIIDYLKLMAPFGKIYGDNLYSKLTTVCEEVRRLAIEQNVCVLSASQTNRESYNTLAPGMENLSDSIGIAQTADSIITIGKDASLQKEDLMMLTVVKSRFSKKDQQFVVRVDSEHMRLVDVGTNNPSSVARITKPKKEESKPEVDSDFSDSFGDNTKPIDENINLQL